MKNKLFLLCLITGIQILSGQDTSTITLMEQDWPELKRYADSNASIVGSGNLPEVVFMGNSITEGWVHMDPEFFKEHNFAGRGIGGQTTPQMLLRFMADVVALQPKVVVILAGTNDLAGNTGYASTPMITNNIKAMSILAQAHNIRVVLCSVLPVFDYPWRPGLDPVGRIAELNAWIEDFAEKEGHVYCDYFSAMATDEGGMKPAYSEDGVHPNQMGYRVMKPILREALERAYSAKGK